MRPESAEVRRTLVECAWAMRADPQVLDAMEGLAFIADNMDCLRTLAPESRAQLGEVLALTGERERAIWLFEDVLDQQADNAAALRGLAGLRAQSGESIAAWTLKRQLAETVADEEERFQMLLETADGFATKVNRSDLAVEVYEQARAIKPHDHHLLHKLLAQYQSLEEWPKVCEVLRAIADADDDTSRKAKVVMTMGQIAHAKLEDRAAAVMLYDEALDLDPARIEAFERIVRILTEVEDWHSLEGIYQRMLARAVSRSDARLQHTLHHQLGLVYRDRLGDKGNAIASFRSAVALRPNDEEDQAILRELLAMSGQADGAVMLTLDRVRREPLDPAPYRALYDLLAQFGYRDRAWCIASIMAHVEPSHAPASSFHHATPAPSIDRIAGTLGAEGYRRLLHPDLDPTLTAIFEVMSMAAVEMRVAQLGFRERLAYPGPPLTQPELLLQDVKGASRILGVPPPRLFVAKTPPAIGVGVTQPPSLVVHPQSLPGFPRNQLAFWVGKRLAELTPPLLARALFRAVSELKELVALAARIVQDKRDKQNPTDEPWRAHIRKDRFRELAAAVEHALGAGALDVRRWSQLADLSTSRAGLVVAGDVECARLALMREGQSPGDLSPREQMRELVAFVLSEEYAQMRAMLGVTLP
jgi:tetratricopeptide (TPR) repeat protein